MTGIPEFEAAPWRAPEAAVLPEWIDYNGHMNVTWYTHAFDIGIDAMLDVLGCGPAAARGERLGPYALQTQYHYLAELREGERLRCAFRILDHDARRLHLWGEMTNTGTGAAAALIESLILNVDLTARRAAPFPERAAARIAAMAAAQAGLPRPERAGAAIGIRRRA